MIASYLAAERDVGRIAADADVGRIAADADVGRIAADADVGRIAADADRAGYLMLAGRRRPAGGRRRPQDGDHGHRRRSARTVAPNGQARTRGSGAGRHVRRSLPARKPPLVSSPGYREGCMA
jgi:hypothetical protein